MRHGGTRRAWFPKNGQIDTVALDGFEWGRPREGRPQDPDEKRVANYRYDPTPPGLCCVCRRLLDTSGPKCSRCGNRAGVA